MFLGRLMAFPLASVFPTWFGQAADKLGGLYELFETARRMGEGFESNSKQEAWKERPQRERFRKNLNRSGPREGPEDHFSLKDKLLYDSTRAPRLFESPALSPRPKHLAICRTACRRRFSFSTKLIRK